MQKSSVNPLIVQDMLDSASNAALKGQSQFFTPPAFGRQVAEALPAYRPVICDLNCGRGDFLTAAANETTVNLIGCDIDPVTASKPVLKIDSDLTLLYPMMREIRWQADLFVLNPPWDLHWHRSRLADLSASPVQAVREAFAGNDGRIGKDQIDSTIATLLIAIECCSSHGEGVLIANAATIRRLVTDPLAPHRAIAKHIWAILTIPGNPMTGIAGHQWGKDEGDFQTALVYFARDHFDGVRFIRTGTPETTAAVRSARHQRLGQEVRHEWQANKNTFHYWHGMRDELKARAPEASKNRWNIWLGAAGEIRTGLNLFQRQSSKIDIHQAARLASINGKLPMTLVLQREQRDELMALCNVPNDRKPERELDAPWRIHPEVQDAVRAAVAAYHACRAPLYPLPEIQRIGYLDEAERLECKADLRSEAGTTLFHAGKPYRVSTKTVTVIRHATRPNLAGEDEAIEYTGSELAIFLADRDGGRHCFMEARLSDPNVNVHGDRAGDTLSVNFTLQDLVNHFHIPEVEDVSQSLPAEFQAHLDTLAALEELLA
jgi:predicted RNA methylase